MAMAVQIVLGLLGIALALWLADRVGRLLGRLPGIYASPITYVVGLVLCAGCVWGVVASFRDALEGAPYNIGPGLWRAFAWCLCFTALLAAMRTGSSLNRSTKR